MHVVLHVTGYFDWEPVPADVEVTDEDIEAMRVKQGQSGQWLMKVEKTEDVRTHTSIGIPESELFVAVVAEMTRGDKQPLSRLQAVYRYISRFHLDHNTHPDWIDEVEVDTDPVTTIAEAGGDAALAAQSIEGQLRAYLAEHVAAGNIQTRDVERLVKKYLEPSTSSDLVDHLHEVFGVTPDKIAKRRETRAARKAAAAEAQAKHLADIQAAADATSKVALARRKNKKGAA